MKKLIFPRFCSLIAILVPALKNKAKAWSELYYWKTRKKLEGNMSNKHFEYFYTSHFNIEKKFYTDKKILDIGCGPRGSLEWAHMAERRVGLDPLADRYRILGTDNHKMEYVATCAEQIPFSSDYFDVVSCFNALDHVSNLNLAIESIIRVLKPGGIFLFLTELKHHATAAEPITFSWDVTKTHFSKLKIIEERHYEKSANGIYETLWRGIQFNHNSKRLRPGILSAKFLKPK